MSTYPRADQLKSRYKDAYRQARTIVGIGSTVKVTGGVIGIIMILGTLIACSQLTSGTALGVFIVGAVCSSCVVLLIWVCGVLISSQGQIMKACLDSAINSSPFLSDEHRAEAMSLK